jgi:hypothetical protein
MQRLRPLSEEECYLRCYGWTGADDAVRVLHDDRLPPEVAAVLAERARHELGRMLDEQARAEAEAA